MRDLPAAYDRKAREAELARLVAAGHGAVSTRQLRGIGFSESWLVRAQRSGRITRVHQGIYVVGVPDGTIEQRCAAGRLAGGRSSAVSNVSASALLGYRKDYGGPIHLTLPQSRKNRSGLIFHRGRLQVEDTWVVQGIRVTSPARTLVDLADVLTPDQLERALSEAHRLGHVDRHALPPTPRGRRGLGHLDRHRMTRSGIERAFLKAIQAAPDVPDPETNVELLGYEADAFWRDAGVVAEIDHYATHGDRLAFERDRRKRNHYTLEGLLVLQVTEETLPGAADAVRRALALRSPRRSTPPPPSRPGAGGRSAPRGR